MLVGLLKNSYLYRHGTGSLYWDYFLATLFVFSSDAVCWFMYLTPAVCFSSLLFFSLINFLKQNGRNNKSSKFIIISSIFIFFNGYVYEFNYQNNSAAGFVIAQIATFLFLASYDFYYFRKIITDVVFVICLLGIPLYIATEIGLLSYSIFVAGNAKFLSVGPFIMGWEFPFHRFAGVWHEPGACQIILNFILLIHLKDIQKWHMEPGRLKQIVLIVVALILTKSTGGYLCFMILMVTALINMQISDNKKYIVWPLAIFVTCIAAYFLFNSETIQNKIFVDDSENISKQMRTADALALWQMSIERPLLGWGLGSEAFFQRSIALGNLTSSSGILKFAASMGWLWVFILLRYYWVGIRKIFPVKSALFILLAYVIMMNNEDFIEFPISNLLLFTFASYITPKYINE